MDAETAVETIDLNALPEFSDERRVRKKLIQSERIVSEIVYYEPGQGTKLHVHPHQDEIFVCLAGRGAITFADRAPMPMETGSLVFVPAGVRHGVETGADSRLTLMFTKGPGLPNPNRKRRAD